VLSISVLIPLTGYKRIPKTIESVENQQYEKCEILILRNDIADLPEGREVVEREYKTGDKKKPLREILIRERGKGNALNEGLRRANGEIIAVVDADCILSEGALHTAVKHFENDKVAAVGGRLLVMREDGSLLEKIQSYEYMKTFELARRLFALLSAQCLVSGAFGMFRKSALTKVGGYDTDTVGEDMELVLRLQDGGLFRKDNKIVYEPKAVCFTGVPHSIKRLLRQRDRWQRGLLDCLLKHMNMVLNPYYGFLGIIALVYQMMFELIGPIFCLLYLMWPWYREILPKIQSWGLIYLLLQFVLSLFATFHASGNNLLEVLRKVPWLALITVICVVYQIFVATARLYGIITFHWRRLVW